MIDNTIKLVNINKLLLKKYIKENNINSYGLDDFIKYKTIKDVVELYDFLLELCQHNKVLHLEVLNNTLRIFYLSYHENRRVMKVEQFRYSEGEWHFYNTYLWDYRGE